jgi:hypothetical protein
MNLPTEDQIDRAAGLLATIRDNGNRRPGDEHIDRPLSGPENIRIQLRARATDMLVIMLNQDLVFRG